MQHHILCCDKQKQSTFLFKLNQFIYYTLFQFTPLPVWHGRGYRSLGFRFGNICYIRYCFQLSEGFANSLYLLWYPHSGANPLFAVMLVRYLKKLIHYWRTLKFWFWSLSFSPSISFIYMHAENRAYEHKHLHLHFFCCFMHILLSQLTCQFLLFQDALRPDRSSSTHFGLQRVR